MYLQRFVVPIMQEYIRSGAFRFIDRIKDALVANLIFYSSVAVPAIGFVLYAIFSLGLPM
jgi:hypothetical protein